MNNMQPIDIFQPPMPQMPEQSISWTNLHGASTGLAISNAIREASGPLLVIAPDSLYAAHLVEQIEFYLGSSEQILVFPDWETLPYDHFSPHQDIISDRIAALYRIPTLRSGVIITTVTTLLQRLAPSHFLNGHHFLLNQGDKLNIDILRTRLVNAGYHAVSQVREHGEFAIRGSIIDLYPMGSHQPFRLDLFDDEIDSIREFSPESQRSGEKLDGIRMLPAKEFPITEEAIERFRQAWRARFSGNPLKCPMYQDMTDGICAPGIEYYLPLFFEQTADFFSYLPANTTIVSVDNTMDRADEFWREIKTRYEQARYDVTRPLLPPEEVFIASNELGAQIKKHPRIYLNSQKSPSVTFATSPAPPLEINHKAAKPLEELETYVNKHTGRILFCAESLGRREVLLQLFRSIALSPTFFTSWQAFIKSDASHGIVVAALEEGFSLDDKNLTLLPEAQLYGKRVMQRRLRKKSNQDPDAIIRDLAELQVDDPVVHIDHGVGRYRGLQTLSVGDQTGEFLMLEYQDDAKLYVPVSSLHLISRYTGINPEHTPLNRLGADQWLRVKRKAAEKIRDVAAELLDLYAKRASRPGLACQIPEDQYAVFANAFPFEETPDQLNAIENVFADMTSHRPMDRVICGDVGFGKTEVALRAAFLAVQNNKQVVILVPTTLLAQQHYQNFQDRFADWPIQVGLLSRFKTAKEQKAVLERMEEGKIDIVIGTHKLLQDDIKFKDLGLVIIDEEHRFGVKQKEKLKALRSMVDILTLTATPIPRTLNMALSGIRDLSLIATPPARRLSVNTFVHEYADGVIQEAIQRELLRGGQVYFLHNEVTTINKKAEELGKLVPEARPAVAHGQMHERELERVMSDFYHRHHNILVCSTIIESGIDVPTANTIIINRADKFGLAQLHQLRGRVGRSHHQAYAYLLTPPRSSITSDAHKRLDAIAALDDLGVGFTLATHDLEIRGAGELLGEDQSGNMHEIGFTLYMDLLSRAVDAMKMGKDPDDEKLLQDRRSEVDLHLSALIPEDYLNDVQLRLQFYKRIANAKNQSELDDIQVEMIDRFGLLPDVLKQLFAVTELKLKADEVGIIKMDVNDTSGKLEFNEKPNVKPETIIKLIQDKSGRFRLDGPTRLRFSMPKHEKGERVSLVQDVLNILAN